MNAQPLAMRPCAPDDGGRDRIARHIFVEMLTADGAVQLVELLRQGTVEHRQLRGDPFRRSTWEAADFDVVVLQPDLPEVSLELRAVRVPISHSIARACALTRVPL